MEVRALFYFFLPLGRSRKPAAALNPWRIGERRDARLIPTILLTLAAWHSGQSDSAALLAAPLPHDATARQRNGWPSLNRAERVSLAVLPTSSTEETCMCVQCGCVGVLPDGGPLTTVQ